MIVFEGGAIQVDASVIGEGLGIEPSLVQELVRAGRITSRFEQGQGDDSGRYRLTFFTESSRFRLIIDEQGQVIQRSTIDFAGRLLPMSAHKPGV